MCKQTSHGGHPRPQRVQSIWSTSFPGLFPFELGRRPNSKGKSPGNEVVHLVSGKIVGMTFKRIAMGTTMHGGYKEAPVSIWEGCWPPEGRRKTQQTKQIS